jgi:hypothetical protein
MKIQGKLPTFGSFPQVLFFHVEPLSFFCLRNPRVAPAEFRILILEANRFRGRLFCIFHRFSCAFSGIFYRVARALHGITY